MCFLTLFLYREPYDLFGIDGIVEWRPSQSSGWQICLSGDVIQAGFALAISLRVSAGFRRAGFVLL